MIRTALVALALAVAPSLALANSNKDFIMENTIVLTLDSGDVIIQLLPDAAPKHVERIKTLAKQNFYDGLKFHRVIPNFMAQTGDPQGTGAGGSSLPDLPAEFSPNLKFQRGTLGMARTSNPNSANSQFFISTVAATWLDGQYTIFGNVVKGMDLIDALPQGEPPSNPAKIVSLRLLEDAS